MSYAKKANVDPALSAHLAAIGARGGASRSARKLAALADTRARKASKHAAAESVGVGSR